MSAVEHLRTFDCFGGRCAVILAGDGAFGPAATALDDVQALLLGWHRDFTRFDAGSELSRLNADPGSTVPVSPLLGRLAQATVDAGRRSGGLVDATLVGPLQDAGYAGDWDGTSLDLADTLTRAPARRAAGPSPRRDWARISVDTETGTISRPPGVQLDSGGLAKGLFADTLAGVLGGYDRFVVDCGGDVRVGGAAGATRDVRIEDPFGRGVLHRFAVVDGAVATSGIGRRSWRDAGGRPAHHLLDPATGRPAFTGLVQVSALAPTAAQAEVAAKAALLSGPGGADAHLPYGGVLVCDGAYVRVVPESRVARPRVRISRTRGGVRLRNLELAR